jgi:hypothetical protein
MRIFGPETASPTSSICRYMGLVVSTVAVAEWQAAILEALLAPTKTPFRTRNGLAALKQTMARLIVC